MPFDPPTIAKLKAALLRHSAADHYTLTPEERVRLATDCALTVEQVSEWCKNVRRRHNSEEAMANFLQRDDTSKVFLICEPLHYIKCYDLIRCVHKNL
jgi:hypothetical protein